MFSTNGGGGGGGLGDGGSVCVCVQGGGVVDEKRERVCVLNIALHCIYKWV